MRFFRLFVLVGLMAGGAAGTRANEPLLKLISADKTLTITAAEFAALPQVELKLPEQGEQKERRYRGVPVSELLKRIGAPLGEKLRGAAQLTGVIVHCKDNYALLFALAEFDEAFSARTIILADKENGEMLPPSSAPLRLVTPGDKRGARSARQVLALEVVSWPKP